MKNIIIKLNKTDERGKLHIWMATIKDNTVIIEYGVHLGKIRREEKTYLEGKNIGKANETTAEEQAILKAHQLWTKQIKKGYSESLADIKNNVIVLPSICITLGIIGLLVY